MGLGETIGYSTRLSMNNASGSLYQNQSNLLNRAIYVALMGDPALRQDVVAPPANLSALTSAGTVALNWTASSDAVEGYHVYRAPSATGPFTRLTASLLPGTSYSDPGLSPGSNTYMVRAVKLESTPSGTYYNASQGLFASGTVLAMAPPITVLAHQTNGTLVLTWNTQSGIVYHVQCKNTFLQNGWSNLSDAITATGSVASWVDGNIASTPQRLYRVVSP
jgi:hypothetical protein